MDFAFSFAISFDRKRNDNIISFMRYGLWAKPAVKRSKKRMPL